MFNGAPGASIPIAFKDVQYTAEYLMTVFLGSLVFAAIPWRTKSWFGRCKVALVSLGEWGIRTTTPQGRLLLGIFGAVAEYERALTRERVIAGVRRAQSKGIHCGRPKVKIQ